MEKDFSYRPGMFGRLAAKVLGGNPARAQWAGHDDQSRFVLLAVGLGLLVAWVGLSVALALSIKTHLPMTAPPVIALSGLIAGMYGVVDLSLARAHLWAMGCAEARRRGFGLVRSRGAALVYALAGLPFAGLRLALAVTMAIFAAGTFGLWWWQDDIAARMAAEHRATNFALQSRIEGEVDFDLAAITAELAGLEARIAARAELQVRETAQMAESADATRSLLSARLVDLTRRIGEKADAILCVQRTMTAEEDGLTTCDGREVTVAKRGPRYDRAEAELNLLDQEKAKLVLEAAGVKSELDALASSAPAATADPETARRDSLRTQRAKMLADRATVVRGRMEADAAFVAPADGLLIRRKALAALAADESVVRNEIRTVEAMFVLLDLSVLMIVFGRSAASIYALGQVVEYETRAQGLIADGQAASAASAVRGLQAEVDQLQAQLNLAQLRDRLKGEMRQMAMTSAVLDQWSEDVAQGKPQADAPRFDA